MLCEDEEAGYKQRSRNLVSLFSSSFVSVSVSVEKDFQNTSEATTETVVKLKYQQSYPTKKPEGQQTINNDDVACYRSKRIID